MKPNELDLYKTRAMQVFIENLLFYGKVYPIYKTSINCQKSVVTRADSV